MADHSGKLYYLRERSRRSANRQARRRAEVAAQGDSERHRPSPQEIVWLSRILVVQAAYVLLRWMAIGVGLVSIPATSDARLWFFSFLPADLAVAALAAITAYDLRRAGKREVLLSLAAGALMVLALAQLTHGIAASFALSLGAGQRFHVTVMGISLYVGLWAASCAVRLRRGRE